MKVFTLIVFSALLCTGCQNQANQDALQLQKATIDSLNKEVARQKIIDSMQAISTADKAESGNVPTSVKPAAKKGWSNTAKGAVIGAGTGAVAGAIISKDKGKGAIIGGLIGAGVGAGTGAIIDKNKKKKAATSNGNQ